MSDRIIADISSIVTEQKAGFTFYEFAYLLLQKKIGISDKSISVIIDSLMSFKNINKEIYKLLLLMVKSYKVAPKMIHYESYINFLIQYKQIEMVMLFLEKTRDGL